MIFLWDKGDKDSLDMVLDNIKSSEPSPETSILNNESKAKLIESLEELDDKYKIPLILQYYRDMTYEDISSALNIKMGTVKSMINEAKRRLRKVLEVKYSGQ